MIEDKVLELPSQPMLWREVSDLGSPSVVLSAPTKNDEKCKEEVDYPEDNSLDSTAFITEAEENIVRMLTQWGVRKTEKGGWFDLLKEEMMEDSTYSSTTELSTDSDSSETGEADDESGSVATPPTKNYPAWSFSPFWRQHKMDKACGRKSESAAFTSSTRTDCGTVIHSPKKFISGEGKPNLAKDVGAKDDDAVTDVITAPKRYAYPEETRQSKVKELVNQINEFDEVEATTIAAPSLPMRKFFHDASMVSKINNGSKETRKSGTIGLETESLQSRSTWERMKWTTKRKTQAKNKNANDDADTLDIARQQRRVAGDLFYPLEEKIRIQPTISETNSGEGDNESEESSLSSSEDESFQKETSEEQLFESFDSAKNEQLATKKSANGGSTKVGPEGEEIFSPSQKKAVDAEVQNTIGINWLTFLKDTFLGEETICLHCLKAVYKEGAYRRRFPYIGKEFGVQYLHHKCHAERSTTELQMKVVHREFTGICLHLREVKRRRKQAIKIYDRANKELENRLRRDAQNLVAATNVTKYREDEAKKTPFTMSSPAGPKRSPWARKQASCENKQMKKRNPEVNFMSKGRTRASIPINNTRRPSGGGNGRGIKAMCP